MLVRRRPGRSPLSPTRAHFRGFASGSRTAAAGRAADRPHAPLVLCQARCCFRPDSPTRSPPHVHLTPRVVARVRVPLRKLPLQKAAAERISVYSRWKRTPPGLMAAVSKSALRRPKALRPTSVVPAALVVYAHLARAQIIACCTVRVVDIVFGVLPAARTSFPALRLASFDSRPFR